MSQLKRLSADDFSQLAHRLASARVRERLPEHLADAGRAVLGGTDAALSVVTAGARIRVAAGTSPRAARADELQGRHREGPGACAVSSRQQVVAADTAADERWPRWGPDAAALGLRSALSIPLVMDDRALAVLQVYHTDRNGFGDEELHQAQILGRHASVAFAAWKEADGLARAVEGRTVIGQAEGILMERYGIDADGAFAMLQRWSQRRNVKLRDLAEQLVRDGGLPDEDDQTASVPLAAVTAS